jgi:predicted dienelactone hydrolase
MHSLVESELRQIGREGMAGISAGLLAMACSAPGEKAPIDTGAVEAPWKDYSYVESGPFPVGHISLEHTYRPFGTWEERTIHIEIWYPASSAEGDPAQYLYAPDSLAFEEAEAAAPVHAAGYPVHVHSHGYQSWGAQSAFLMRHFASHGWIAAAPNHTGNLFGDHQSPLPTAHYIHRPLDIQESLDLVEGLEDLAGPADTSGVLVSGHSFGASYTVWAAAGARYDGVEEACSTGDGIEDDEAGCSDAELAAFLSGDLSDDRIAAGLPMAGTAREAFFGPEGFEEAETPMLFQSGSEDGPESAQAHYDKAQGYDLAWLELEGGCHQTFALGTCDTLEAETGYSIVQGYAMAFARMQILQDDTPGLQEVLDGDESLWQEASMHPPRLDGE